MSKELTLIVVADIVSHDVGVVSNWQEVVLLLFSDYAPLNEAFLKLQVLETYPEFLIVVCIKVKDRVNLLLKKV